MLNKHFFIVASFQHRSATGGVFHTGVYIPIWFELSSNCCAFSHFATFLTFLSLFCDFLRLLCFEFGNWIVEFGNGSSLCNSQCVSFSKVARPAQSVTFSDCCVVFLFPNKCLYSPTNVSIPQQMFIFPNIYLYFPSNVYICHQLFKFPNKCLYFPTNVYISHQMFIILN